MGQNHTQLSLEERGSIAQWQAAGQSRRQIAAALARQFKQGKKVETRIAATLASLATTGFIAASSGGKESVEGQLDLLKADDGEAKAKGPHPACRPPSPTHVGEGHDLSLLRASGEAVTK